MLGIGPVSGQAISALNATHVIVYAAPGSFAFGQQSVTISGDSNTSTSVNSLVFFGLSTFAGEVFPPLCPDKRTHPESVDVEQLRPAGVIEEYNSVIVASDVRFSRPASGSDAHNGRQVVVDSRSSAPVAADVPRGRPIESVTRSSRAVQTSTPNRRVVVADVKPSKPAVGADEQMDTPAAVVDEQSSRPDECR